MAASILAVFTLETAYHLADLAPGLPPLIGLGALRLLEIFLLAGICLGVEKNIAVLGLASRRWTGFLKGLVWSACFAAVAAIVAVAIHLAGIDPFVFLAPAIPAAQARHLTALLLVGGIIGPVAEEIFFRGILYGFFRTWGILTAVIFSTLLFVLPHIGGGVLPFTQTIGGIVFALAYEKEKSLLTPITIHCLGNLAIFSLALAR